MMWNVEGSNIRFKGTERESAFGSEFDKTHPHPPVDLARELYMVAACDTAITEIIADDEA